jgi:hypothetical protein
MHSSQPPLKRRRHSSGVHCLTPPQPGEADGRWSEEEGRLEDGEPRPPLSLPPLPRQLFGPQPTTVALLVREPWVSLLCQGTKTWELRGSRTHKRGRIALAAAGTGGWVVGGATLVGCHGPLSAAQLAAAEALHCVPGGGNAFRRYKTGVYAWEFAHASRAETPLRYEHPAGAVIWVNLPAPVVV